MGRPLRGGLYAATPEALSWIPAPHAQISYAQKHNSCQKLGSYVGDEVEIRYRSSFGEGEYASGSAQGTLCEGRGGIECAMCKSNALPAVLTL